MSCCWPKHSSIAFAANFASPDCTLTERAKAALRSYAWPGNVRELQNAIERAAILSDVDAIDPASFATRREPRPAEDHMPAGMLDEGFSWEGPLEEVSQRAVAHVERFKIENALRDAKWNKTRAAEQLGVSYKTLLTKIRALGLEELTLQRARVLNPRAAPMQRTTLPKFHVAN